VKARTTALAFVLAAGILTAPISSAHAADPDPDPWIAKDKALHFGVSAVIASGTYAVSTAIFDARGHSLLAATGVTLAAGAGKELLDLAGYGTPSWKDFAADVAGMLVGLAVAWSLDLVIRGVDDQHPAFKAPSSNATPRSLAPSLSLTF
jgi:putative lipoprotein